MTTKRRQLSTLDLALGVPHDVQHVTIHQPGGGFSLCAVRPRVTIEYFFPLEVLVNA
jgi:hypothetical protein